MEGRVPGHRVTGGKETDGGNLGIVSEHVHHSNLPLFVDSGKEESNRQMQYQDGRYNDFEVAFS